MLACFQTFGIELAYRKAWLPPHRAHFEKLAAVSSGLGSSDQGQVNSSFARGLHALSRQVQSKTCVGTNLAALLMKDIRTTTCKRNKNPIVISLSLPICQCSFHNTASNSPSSKQFSSQVFVFLAQMSECLLRSSQCEMTTAIPTEPPPTILWNGPLHSFWVNDFSAAHPEE